MTSNPAVMVTLVQLAVSIANCISYGGPSIFEYDIEKQLIYREVPRNLVRGWRQDGDRPIYK
jgi:hypothetical protein